MARDALRRSIVAAIQAGGTRRPQQDMIERLVTYAIDQIEHGMILDSVMAEQPAQDPHG
jgi:hypothetical protein